MGMAGCGTKEGWQKWVHKNNPRFDSNAWSGRDRFKYPYYLTVHRISGQASVAHCEPEMQSTKDQSERYYYSPRGTFFPVAASECEGMWNSAGG